MSLICIPTEPQQQALLQAARLARLARRKAYAPYSSKSWQSTFW